MLDFVKSVWGRLPPERQRFVRFGIVGVSGIVVNMAFLALGVVLFSAAEPGLRDTLASILGIAVSILTNFLLNDVWTWGDRKKGHRKRDFALRMTAYYVGAGIAAGLQFATFAVLRHALGVNVYLAQLGGIALGMALNYIVNNRWVFKDRADTSLKD